MKQTKTMKQTAITISMINEQGMNRTEGQTLRAVDGEQRMTSMEIAELTGKQHKHVMEAIRRMEPAWEKVQGTKFRLSQRNYELPTGGMKAVPCYLLTKTECLYIATKFNDEARARLVLRWQQLEEDRREALEWERWKARWSQIERPQGQRLLGVSDEEILDEADDIIGDELDELNRDSDDCYTPTDIGAPFGLEGRDLNSFLCDKGVIHWSKGQWRLTPKFMHQGLTEDRSFIYHGRNGHRKTQSRLVWTEKGRDFVLGLIG
jgi:phage regulator Rha-like protein